jgi:signal peptidase I
MTRRPRRPAVDAAPTTPETQTRPPRKGLWRELRELWDTLVLAFVLVTLMKTFVVDLYKIPTGSITPTLIGDFISGGEYDEDGDEDLLIFEPTPRGDFRARQVFLRREDGGLRCDSDELRGASRINRRFLRSSVRARYDRILVNKMWYWFTPLGRGNIVVFKLPDRDNPRTVRRDSLFDPLTPFYIKRVAALAGDTPTIADGRILIDGRPLTEPAAFTRNHYFADSPHEVLRYLGVTVPEDEFYVFGDNSGNSLDSRYWGGVEIERLKGRAFLRYWPLDKISLLR